jgi:hypothetical protein
VFVGFAGLRTDSSDSLWNHSSYGDDEGMANVRCEVSTQSGILRRSLDSLQKSCQVEVLDSLTRLGSDYLAVCGIKAGVGASRI